jgi:hypothetical protein
MKLEKINKVAIVYLILLSLTIFSTCKSHTNRKHKKITPSLKSKIKTFFSKFNFNYSDKIPSIWNLKLGIALRDMAALGYVTADSAKSQLIELQKEFPKKIKIQDSNFLSFNQKKEISSTIKEEQIKLSNFKVSHLLKKIFGESDWDHIFTYTNISNFNYSWTVIKSDIFKKIIFSFSGTKKPAQLLEEGKYSGGSKYFRTSAFPQSRFYNVMIMNYFQELYKQFFAQFQNIFFETLKGREEYEIIFCGHSLGGAMASVALFDAYYLHETKQISQINKQQPNLTEQDILKNNLIKRLNLSLITYGQPRTGNYAFANEIKKAAKIIYRHVNDNDLVAKVPGCLTKSGSAICIHEFDENALYNGEYVKLDESDFKFYPWHIRGLVVIRGDIYDFETCNGCYTCLDSGENSKHEYCQTEHSISNFDFHKYYFNYQISKLWKPEVFPAGINDDYSVVCHEKPIINNANNANNPTGEKDPPLLDHHQLSKLQRKVAKKFVWQNELEEPKTIGAKIRKFLFNDKCQFIGNVLNYFGFINRKRKLKLRKIK